MTRQGLVARGDFAMKLAAAAAVAALGDWLIRGAHGNWGMVLLALPPLALITRRALRRDGRVWMAFVLAMAMAGAMVYRPGPLSWCLFWIFAGTGALMPSVARFGDAWQGGQRLVQLGLRAAIAPLLDLLRWVKVRGKRGGPGLQNAIAGLALPLVGSLVIVVLFAQANPVIDGWLNAVIDGSWAFDLQLRALCWLFFGTMAWSLLRARLPFRVLGTFDDGGATVLPGVTVASVLRSLVAFNALFALQNGMDLAWLWGLVPLPHGMTLAAYAHRGAYPLIVTALLAAGFVLVALRPGSATAARPAIRWLVVLWVMQNLLLVASAGLRTLDYIAAYSLTSLRIAALLWMGLVALGLVLVCWRMIRGKSASWLINANAAAALALLSACCFVDLDEIAVQYNIDRARELGGDGPPLDVCFLEEVGPSALVPLARLEQRQAPEAIHLWAQVLRKQMQFWLISDQTSGNWSLLGAMRLAALPATMTNAHWAAIPPECQSRDIHALRVSLGLERAPKPAPVVLTQPTQP